MPYSEERIREDLLELAVEIGPRGACTAAEARAADYIHGRFSERGLDVTTQEFKTIDTYSWLYVAYLSLAVAAGVLAGMFPYWAAPVSLAVAVLFALDLETFGVFSRVFPKKKSVNVIARTSPPEHRVGMVVVAHYDSARAGLSFHPKLVGNFRASFSMMIGGVFALGALSITNLVIRAAAGRVNFWVWMVACAVAAYLLFPIAVMIHREIALNYTPGANDNASGVAAMLAVMDKMTDEDSRMPGVMFVATGAEEVGTAGMIEFLKSYGPEIGDALVVNLDNLGTGHVCYIDCEGMLFGHRSSPVLLWLSEKVIREKKFPIWRAGYRLLSTDATPALARGFDAMSVMAFDDEGGLPNWHWASDTVEHIEMENLQLVRAFLWNLARRIGPP